jgi:hypothetical protein
MTTATEEELYQTGGYGFATIENDRLKLRFPELPKLRIRSSVEDATEICYLARLLAGLGNGQGSFGGAMIWVAEWTASSNGPRAIALEGIELQRRACGENRPVSVTPVHYFEAHEYEASLSMLVLMIVGGLDGYYYPDWGCPNYLLRLSGASYVEVTSYDENVMRDTRTLLDASKWIKYGEPAT